MVEMVCWHRPADTRMLRWAFILSDLVFHRPKGALEIWLRFLVLEHFSFLGQKSRFFSRFWFEWMNEWVNEESPAWIRHDRWKERSSMIWNRALLFSASHSKSLKSYYSQDLWGLKIYSFLSSKLKIPPAAGKEKEWIYIRKVKR